MAARSKSKKSQERASVTNTDPLTLTCEWQDCQDVYDDMDAFCDHLEEHLRSFVPPDIPEDTSMICEWQECGHEMSCILELVRHVYFHAFHMKIKSHGYTLILKNKWRGCSLESASRNTIPDLPERFQCDWYGCTGIFDNPDLFYKHVKNHADCYQEGNHVPGGCKCLWEGCELVLKSKHKLKGHLRTHTQEKTVACPTCGSLFSTSCRFQDHIKRQQDCEDADKCYQCSYCSKRFPSERILKDHMRHHVNHYKCPYCEMTCPSPSNLKMHIDYKHSDGKPHKCSVCDYSAKSSNDIRRHTERLHSRSLLKCEVQECSYKCRNLSEYKHHYRNQHEGHDRPYKCHVCGEEFKRGTRLTTHLKKKHKFKWLPGHSRFRFKQHDDGYYRLQTVRYESVEVPPDESQPCQDDSTSSEKPDNANMNTTSTPVASAKKKPRTTRPRKPASRKTKKPPPADNNNKDNDEDDEVTVTMVSKGKKRKKKNADLSYNLEMLGDVALNMSRDDDSNDGGRVVKVQRMSSPENVAANPEAIHHMPTASQLLGLWEGSNSASTSNTLNLPCSSVPVSPGNHGNIWRHFGENSVDSVSHQEESIDSQRQFSVDDKSLDSQSQSSEPNAKFPKEQVSAEPKKRGGSSTESNEQFQKEVDSEDDDANSQTTVVASLLDANGQMVYVTSNVAVSFADPVHIIAPLDSDAAM